MQIDPESARSMQANARGSRRHREPWAHLLDAVLRLGGAQARLLRHGERPWASATFSGTRHTVALSFAGAGAQAAGDAFIAALPEHEFSIPGQLVADAAITAVDQVLLPEPLLTVEAELLLLEDI